MFRFGHLNSVFFLVLTVAFVQPGKNHLYARGLTLSPQQCDAALRYLREQFPKEPHRFERFAFQSHNYGNPDRELLILEDIFYRTLKAQERLSNSFFNRGKKGRVQHREGLKRGFLGEATVLKNSLNSGLFALPVGTKIPFVGRYSFGQGLAISRLLFANLMPDVKGLGLKFLHTGEVSELDKKPFIDDMDITMTNTRSALGSNPWEFMKFVELQAAISNLNFYEAAKKLASWAPHQKRALLRLAESAGVIVPSVLSQKYGSGHPHLVGEQPVQFAVELSHDEMGKRIRGATQGLINFPVVAAKTVLNQNYLADDLGHWLAQGPINAKLRGKKLGPTDLETATNLVEDGLNIWRTSPENLTEDLLDIHIFRQFSMPKLNAMVEDFMFTPLNFTHEHRGMGAMGRGRPWPYAASALGRVLTDPGNPFYGRDPVELLNGKAYQEHYREVLEMVEHLKTLQ